MPIEAAVAPIDVCGGFDDVLHPSVQVGQYRQYLADSHSAFHEEPGNVRLEACCYLHYYNLANDDALLAAKFDDAVRRQPLFDASHYEALSMFLSKRLDGGAGKRVLDRVEGGELRPSRKLMEHSTCTQLVLYRKPLYDNR